MIAALSTALVRTAPVELEVSMAGAPSKQSKPKPLPDEFSAIEDGWRDERLFSEYFERNDPCAPTHSCFLYRDFKPCWAKIKPKLKKLIKRSPKDAPLEFIFLGTGFVPYAELLTLRRAHGMANTTRDLRVVFYDPQYNPTSPLDDLFDRAVRRLLDGKTLDEAFASLGRVAEMTTQNNPEGLANVLMAGEDGQVTAIIGFNGREVEWGSTEHLGALYETLIRWRGQDAAFHSCFSPTFNQKPLLKSTKYQVAKLRYGGNSLGERLAHHRDTTSPAEERTSTGFERLAEDWAEETGLVPRGVSFFKFRSYEEAWGHISADAEAQLGDTFEDTAEIEFLFMGSGFYPVADLLTVHRTLELAAAEWGARESSVVFFDHEYSEAHDVDPRLGGRIREMLGGQSLPEALPQVKSVRSIRRHDQLIEYLEETRLFGPRGGARVTLVIGFNAMNVYLPQDEALWKAVARTRREDLVYHDCIAHPDNDQGITEFEYYGRTVEEKAKEAPVRAERDPMGHRGALHDPYAAAAGAGEE